MLLIRKRKATGIPEQNLKYQQDAANWSEDLGPSALSAACQMSPEKVASLSQLSPSPSQAVTGIKGGFSGLCPDPLPIKAAKDASQAVRTGNYL